MRNILIIIAAIAAVVAGGADYQSAVVKQIETTTTNAVSWNGKGWDTDDLFTLSADPGKYTIKADRWNVPGMSAPTEGQIISWAAADDGAYRAIPRGAEEVAWTNLITTVGGTLPVQEGDIMVLAANIKGQIAAKKTAKDAAVSAQEWADAFGLQDDINKLTEQGTEITALSGVLGARKYVVK